MIIRLAHVEVGVRDLERSREFYVDILGFTEAHRSDEALHLRASNEYDLWSLKLTRTDGPGMLSAGFRVSSPTDFADLRAGHEQLGLRHALLPDGYHLGRGEGLRVSAPGGHVLDFHHDIDEIEIGAGGAAPIPPMRRREAATGVPPTEIDHINIRVPDIDDSIAYFTGTLGFSVSELGLNAEGGRQAAWMRRTRTNHDVACVRAPEPGVHHFAYSVADGQTMLRTADLLRDAGYVDALQFGPGRHGASNALAMYFLDPDGNRIEFFCGDYHRDLDRPANVWSHEDLNSGGRFWWGVEPQPDFDLLTPVLNASWPEAAAAEA